MPLDAPERADRRFDQLLEGRGCSGTGSGRRPATTKDSRPIPAASAAGRPKIAERSALALSSGPTPKAATASRPGRAASPQRM